MKIGIVGWGLEGQSAFRHFGPEHEYLIVNESEQDDFPPESDRVKVRFLAGSAPIGIGGQVANLSYLEGIEACDKIIYQPTSYFNLKKAFGDDPDFWAKATTVYNIFFEACPTKNIIGVTGTKGKGTTSTLIAKMLGASGKTVHLGGNIGTPILDMLPQIKESDWVVWELANFQLRNAAYSPHISVCLMIVPEHMDWHPDMKDYLEAKANIFRYQEPTDIAIYFADNEYSKQIAGYSPGRKVPYLATPGASVREDGMIVIGERKEEIISKTEVKLLGEHNLQNVCAALTAVYEAIGTLDKTKEVLSSFSGLEHRLELVRELQGVKYYDDSFGTTPDTAIVAIKAVGEPKVLIAGGSDKGADYSDMVTAIIKSDVKHVVCIGVTGYKIADMLESRADERCVTYTVWESSAKPSMPEIIRVAKEHAAAGDAVLLSTGSASFGLFKNYKDRGDQFKVAVQALV
jgi:UDP-N-acetylmuramoylalanine--D-glutamate ligase